MKKPIRDIVLLVTSIILSTWVYPLIQGLWATLYIPITSNLPRTQLAGGAWLSAGAASGSLICALMLAWPLGYLTKGRAMLQGIALGVIGTMIHLYNFPSVIKQFNWFVGSISIIEHFTFLIGCTLFASWGSRIANKGTGQPDDSL